MVRWFPDQRGLATGLTAAGYGFGAIFTSFPIDNMIKTSGYAHTLVVWGITQGVIGIIAAQGLRLPPEGGSLRAIRRRPRPQCSRSGAFHQLKCSKRRRFGCYFS
jgi:MFS transporter, OFA family, oxalate/formate antiporter